MRQFARHAGARIFDHVVRLVPPGPLASLCDRLQARPNYHPSSFRSGVAGSLSMLMRHLLWRGYSLRSQGHTFELRWLDGIRVIASPKAEVCQLLFVLGEYEPSEFQFLSRFLAPGMTVVDVGANIGLYTVFAANRIRAEGTVLAFEPSSREYQRLETNVKLNGFENVKAFHIALSDRAEAMDLIVADDIHSGHNTLGRLAYASVHRKAVEKVLARRLDDVATEMGLEHVDLIKIDAEGHELAVLRGAAETIRRFRPLLLVELFDAALGPQGASVADVRALLGEWRYKLHGLAETNSAAGTGRSVKTLNGLAIPDEKGRYASDLDVTDALLNPASSSASSL